MSGWWPGALIGFAIFVTVALLLTAWGLRWSKKQVEELQTELDEREEERGEHPSTD